jgi:hypothetical protein
LAPFYFPFYRTVWPLEFRENLPFIDSLKNKVCEYYFAKRKALTFFVRSAAHYIFSRKYSFKIKVLEWRRIYFTVILIFSFCKILPFLCKVNFWTLSGSWKFPKTTFAKTKRDSRKDKELLLSPIMSAICGQVYEHPAVRPQPGEAAAHGRRGGLGLHQRQLRSWLQLQARVHRHSGSTEHTFRTANVEFLPRLAIL